MAQADLVFATTDVIAGEARELGARDVRVLPNGYDAADLTGHEPDPDGPLRLTFMGKIYRNLTEPWNLFAALAQAHELRPDLDIRLDVIGDASDEVHGVAGESGLADKVDFTGYLPHREALARVARADVAVVLIADRPGSKGPIAGKMFEYLAIGLPTLALAPVDGEAARLVTTLRAGWVVAPHDVAAITARLIDLAESKQRGSLGVTIDPAAVARYDRRALSAELASALNEVTGK
jgi:glycosyltransferase involved in cell wall biosynthesis